MKLSKNQLEEISKEELIERFLVVQDEAFPNMGPSYKFQLSKAVKKIGALSRSNQYLLNSPDTKVCKNCKFLHEQTCSKFKKTNLAALVKWSGCGLFCAPE